MREILFRGKRVDNGEWIEGFYAHSGEKKYTLIDNDIAVGYLKMKEVNPHTIGQYTGLTDKNGKKIFEWDIVRWCGIKGIVVWEGHKFYVKSNLLWDFSDDDCIEVIGNVHDNPELLRERNGGDTE